LRKNNLAQKKIIVKFYRLVRTAAQLFDKADSITTETVCAYALNSRSSKVELKYESK